MSDTTLFGPALAQLRRGAGQQWTQPQAWRAYCKAHGIVARSSTPNYISLQHAGDLKAELVAEDVMVLRVGRGVFSLVRARNVVEQFFLPSESPETHQVQAVRAELSADEWCPFRLLGAVTESTALQLAAGSGVLGRALHLDKPERVLTARSHVSRQFAFRPLASHADTLVYSGQVEIDAAFVAERNHVRSLFVVEAKHSGRPRRLAKHKLAFACHALLGGPSPILEELLQVVPVFVRSWQGNGALLFEIVECEAFDIGKIPAVDGFTPSSTSYWSIDTPFG